MSHANKRGPPRLRISFSDTPDLTLVSSDGSLFEVSSGHLARASGFFKGMVALPKPASKSTGRGPPSPPLSTRSLRTDSVALLEDSATLDVVLSLAHGVPAPFDRLESWRELEHALCTAEKYEMPGVSQILLMQLLLRATIPPDAPTRTQFYVFAAARHYGFDDVAKTTRKHLLMARLDLDNVPSLVSMKDLASLLSEREKRVQYFTQKLQDVGRKSSFGYENSGVCRQCNNYFGQRIIINWMRFVGALVQRFQVHPSLDAVLAHSTVRSAVEALENDYCGHCRYVAYPWRRIHAKLYAILE